MFVVVRDPTIGGWVCPAFYAMAKPRVGFQAAISWITQVKRG